MAASLDGIEARLREMGEAPRFAVAGPSGSHLQHSCSTFLARVNFWPSTLLWNVEGPRSSVVEAALLLPVGEAGEEEGDEEHAAAAL